MTLNRADFPEMTDEQWNSIVAEADRRATTASETARKNAEKEAEGIIQAKIAEALETERAKLEADEQGKLEIQRKELDKQQAKIDADRKGLLATKKLTGVLPEDVIDGLLPMFTGVDDKVLPTVLDTFVKGINDGVKAQVDTEKKTLLENATPPTSPTGAPVDNETAALKMAEAGDLVGAIDAMLPKAPAG